MSAHLSASGAARLAPAQPKTRGFLHINRHGPGPQAIYVVTYHKLNHNGSRPKPVEAVGAQALIELLERIGVDFHLREVRGALFGPGLWLDWIAVYLHPQQIAGVNATDWGHSFDDSVSTCVSLIGGPHWLAAVRTEASVTPPFPAKARRAGANAAILAGTVGTVTVPRLHGARTSGVAFLPL